MAWIDPIKKLRMAMAYMDVNQTELAARMGLLPQNLNRAMNQSGMPLRRLRQAAEALGAELEISFIFPDGTRI